MHSRTMRGQRKTIALGLEISMKAALEALSKVLCKLRERNYRNNVTHINGNKLDLKYLNADETNKSQ